MEEQKHLTTPATLILIVLSAVVGGVIERFFVDTLPIPWSIIVAVVTLLLFIPVVIWTGSKRERVGTIATVICFSLWIGFTTLFVFVRPRAYLCRLTASNVTELTMLRTDVIGNPVKSLRWVDESDGDILAVATAKAVHLYRPEVVPFLGQLRISLIDTFPVSTNAIALEPEGRLIAFGDRNFLEMRDRKTKQTIRRFPAHRGNITSLDFAPDGTTLASGSDDGVINIWKRNGNFEKSFISSGGSVRELKYQPIRGNLAYGTESGLVVLLDTDTKQETKLGGHIAKVSSLAFHPSGRWLVSGSHDKTVRLWDLNSLESAQDIFRHDGAVASVTVWGDEDDPLIGATGDNGKPTVWRMKTKERKILPESGYKSIYLIAVAPECTVLASNVGADSLALWGLRPRTLVDPLPADSTCR